MKTISLFLVIQAITTTSIYCQNTTDSLEQRINILIKKFNAGALNTQESKEITDLTYIIQNKGFTLEEQFHDYQNSLIYIDKALNIWIAINDTTNEANNRKYRGLLLGYLKRFPEAKKEIQIAINLFTIVKRYYGVAVSHFDLSKVFESEGLMDSAFYYVNEALTYWQKAKDTSRITIYTNYKIHLYLKIKDYVNAEQLQQHSEALFLKKDLYWKDYIDFYCLSARIYEKLHRSKIAKKYNSLYNQQIESLKKRNISAKSAYL